MALALAALPALAWAQGMPAWLDDRKADNRPSAGGSAGEFSRAARRAAAGDASEVLRLADPEKSSDALEANTLSVRAMALVIARRPAEAAADCARAEKRLSERPPQVWDIQTCRNLAWAYGDLGNYPAYFNMLRRVFRHSGRDQEWALNALAWALATCPQPRYRNGREAVTLAEAACQRTGWKDPSILDTLAAASAEAGRWDEAVRRQEETLALMKRKDSGNAGGAEKRLALYRARKPYTEDLGPAGRCRHQFASY